MHDKSPPWRFCYFYGVFPGNDVIITALLKYRSLIGYCHGGGEIYKVELWEAPFESGSSNFVVYPINIAFLMGEKRLFSRWFSTNGFQTNGGWLLSPAIAAMTKGSLSDGHCTRAQRTRNYMRHYHDCTSRLFSDGRCTEYQITLREFPVSHTCCILLQILFNIIFALYSSGPTTTWTNFS